MRDLFASILCLLSISSVSALYESSSSVQTFTKKSEFRSSVLNSDSVWVVQFFAPWCGHCKSLHPKFEAAAGIAKGIVHFAAIDTTDDGGKKIASDYEVSGFPTLMIFAGDKKSPIKYEGKREVQDMLQGSMQEVSNTMQARATVASNQNAKQNESGSSRPKGSKVVTLTKDNFQTRVLDNPEPCMVAFVAPWCGHCKALKPEWDEASLKLDGQGTFLGIVDATVEEELASMFKVKGFPTIKVFRGGLNKTPGDAKDYEGERNAHNIAKAGFAEVDKTGVPKEIPQLTSQEVFNENCQGSNKICVLVALPHILESMAAGRNKQRELIASVGKRFRGTAFHFLWFEGGSQLALENGLDLTFGYPAVAAVSVDKEAYVVMRGSFNEKAISTFLTGITAGRQRTAKYENLPEAVTVEAWDGLDGVPFEEEPLDDFWDDDDDDEKAEL